MSGRVGIKLLIASLLLSGSLLCGAVEQDPLTPEEKSYNIHLVTPVSLYQRAIVLKELRKVPPGYVEVVNAGGGGVDLMVGQGVSQHPEFKKFKGRRTGTKGDGGRTYDYVGGVGGGPYYFHKPMVILVNQLSEWDADNTVLHEYGHTYDAFCGDVSQHVDLSDQPEWLKIHKATPWKQEYERKNPAESFAVAFSFYYDSAVARKHLPIAIQEYFWKLEKIGC